MARILERRFPTHMPIKYRSQYSEKRIDFIKFVVQELWDHDSNMSPNRKRSIYTLFDNLFKGERKMVLIDKLVKLWIMFAEEEKSKKEPKRVAKKVESDSDSEEERPKKVEPKKVKKIESDSDFDSDSEEERPKKAPVKAVPVKVKKT